MDQSQRATAVLNGETYDVTYWEVLPDVAAFVAGTPAFMAVLPLVWLELTGDPPHEREQLSVTLIGGDRSWTGGGRVVEVRQPSEDESSFSVEMSLE
jgi:hypothetical protein